ncbi:MAG: thioredoxin domain-containing protein [bacterium]
MKKAIIIILLSVMIIGGGALLKKDNKQPIASPTNNTFGAGKSGVVLKEYADFQCPGCGGFYPILKEVKEKYKDQITFQFVNFPLTQIHQNAMAAHRAALAASNQGKFWEMHNILYENQNTWKDSINTSRDFEAYATQLGLDIPKYKIDFASSATSNTIQADIQTGQALKVTGTPTFFLDGKQLEDNNAIASLEKFSVVIDAAIAAKTGQPATANTTPSAESATKPL